MTDPSQESADLLRTSLAAATRRWRLEFLAQTLGRLGIALAAGFGLWATLAFLIPEVTRHWTAGAMVAGAAIILVLIESRLREPDQAQIRQRIDTKLNLSDAVLTASELQENGATGAWSSRQLTQTAASLRDVNWRQAWPVRVARTVPLTYALAIAAALFLGTRFAELRARELPPPPTARERADARTLRDLFDDWDKSQQDQPDADLKKLLEELRPLRARLAQKDAAIKEREVFKELSRVEEKLAALQAKLEAQSLEPMAADMAAALDGVNGLSALASAVRRGDFENAEAQADAAAKQMQTPGAPSPQSAQETETAQKFDKLAQQFGQKGNASAQQSMEQMKNGLQKQQAPEMGKGLAGLKQSLGQQNARDDQKRSMQHQMRQAGAGKNGAGKKEGMAGGGLSLMPRLSAVRQQQQQQRGKGADRSTDPNRRTAATELASTRGQENISGNANEQGESDTENLSTTDMTQEKAGRASAANFKSYEALSQQAVGDENLPLAHRQTIKRYFESIRPPEGK